MKYEKGKIDELAEKIIEFSHLSEDDMFTTVLFYYLAGRFPEMTIAEAASLSDEIRSKLLNR